MSQGLERRAQPVDNLRGAEAVNPVTRSVPSVGTPSTPSTPNTSYGASIAAQVSKFTSGKLAAIQAKRQERSMMDGQIAAMQGDSFESVETGGDKWALEGYRAVSAQTLSASLLRAQEADIASGAYEQDPATFRETLVNRIDTMVSGIDDERTRVMARDQLMSQMPKLIDTHTRKNTAFKEQQNFDTLANSVDVLSRDSSSTGALLSFADGSSEATAGLSQERRRSAVVQGVVNSFQNNNPAAYAHLDSAEFFNTENLTVSQLQTIESAKAAYHSRMEQSFSAEWKEEWTDLNDRIQLGDVNPIVAAEEAAAINAKYGRRTTAAQANGIYDAARAGVEFAEGTRGINARAAAVSGNYALQARIMQGSVIKQESNNNPNAVSHKGATGLMQLMPETAVNPGFGVRGIFQVARDMGVPVMAETPEVANALMLNAEVNKAQGTEYLTAMLKRYGGDMPRALAAYNWGAGNADDWDGDMSKLPKETRGYITNIMSSMNDNRPNPEADRAASELAYENARTTARLDVLEAMGPAMAQNDEMFSRGELPVDVWRAGREDLYEQYGIALNAERVNQEQKMMRDVIGARITELQKDEANVLAVQQGVQLETSLAAADIQRNEMLKSFEDGTSEMTLPEIDAAYMESVLTAYTESGAELDAKDIKKRAAEVVRQSSDVVIRAMNAQDERALISNAETAGTVGTLPKDLQEKALDRFDKQLDARVENMQAENPNMSPAIVGAVKRKERVEYIANNNIVDEEVQQVINNAATGQSWLLPDGKPNPRTVAALSTFLSIQAKNPALAARYVSDPAARGRMNAAANMVVSQFPDRAGFTDVDLSNVDDPVTNAIYDSVQQMGLSQGLQVSPEETASRVDSATRLLNRGDLRATFWSGTLATDAATALIPQSILQAGVSGVFDIRDTRMARSIDNEAVNRDVEMAVTRELEQVLPYMPATSNEAAVRMAIDHVVNRGAVMGSSFVMPAANEPSIASTMFGGDQVQNTAAVNTAIAGYITDPEVYNATDENGNYLNPRLKQVADDAWWYEGVPDYSVTYMKGRYVARIVGYGSVLLDLPTIGNHYKTNR